MGEILHLDPPQGACFPPYSREAGLDVVRTFRMLDEEPTFHDLEKFLRAVPKISLRTDSTRTDVGRKTLRKAFDHTLQSIYEKHGSFTLMRDDKRRVTAILSSLQKRVIIVREPRRDLQWMPDQVMIFVTRALMIDGMRHGTSNWTILTIYIQ